ncbi:Long-chain-fatty-acid--CoA ligase FadD15 [Vibrio aerogenes CECT 7868]|uniref:Long-chain-fatty-acid--CoA ligase FadD15 n=1 Tax=Vibrio aerogenes CECT 7868 TaxID=1216006 RepID=A0A1M5ZK95_9VIBR|nr:AMP-binding protein [Vibrio aerogenes]SHI24578.1 Long-chain-fatty-acid--CoA ligase FadD15 [Vibrio aerogenes CECT 7868]
MNIIYSVLKQATLSPHAPAVIQLDQSCGQKLVLSYETLISEAAYLARQLSEYAEPRSHIGIVMGNTPAWVVADIALMLSDQIEVPVPLAFSAEQAAFLLSSCKIILTDETGADRLEQWRQQAVTLPEITLAVGVCSGELRKDEPLTEFLPAQQDQVIKVIHTSGTTSTPKGVRIRSEGLNELVRSLRACVNQDDYQCYLNLVPLSLLIEQVTAIYMPLTSGGCLLMPPADMAPLGDPGVTAEQRLNLIHQTAPSAMTLTPALVDALAEKARQYDQHDERVQALFGSARVPLLAAGGAPVTKETLLELDGYGIPVYQGYGLSENSSVATWNHRGANRIGTVGKPLRHVEVRIAGDGELCIRSSSLFAGYANQNDPSCCDLDDDGWLHTGDLASQDQEGYISVTGRKKTMIITANGRNISPEWLESAYQTLPGIFNVIVYGDQDQFLQGIFIVDPQADPGKLRQSVQDYAVQHLNQIEHIRNPLFIPHSESVVRRLFTVTGRPRRKVIAEFMSTYKGAQNAVC